MKVSSILARLSQTEVELENISLYEMNLTEKTAAQINFHICSHFGLKLVPVFFVNKKKTKASYFTRQGQRYKKVKGILGTNFGTDRIELYAGGQNVGVLLHELSHQEEYNHSAAFYNFNLKLIKWFKENLKEKFFPSIETVEDIVNKKKENKEETLKTIIEELESEAVNNTLRMKTIGQALVDEGLNNLKNVQTVKKALIDKGIKII